MVELGVLAINVPLPFLRKNLKLTNSSYKKTSKHKVQELLRQSLQRLAMNGISLQPKHGRTSKILVLVDLNKNGKDLVFNLHKYIVNKQRN